MGEREEQFAQAEENLRRLKDWVAVVIERRYHKVERTRNLFQVTNEVLKLHQESERLAQNQLNQGSLLVSEHRQATAETYKAQTTGTTLFHDGWKEFFESEVRKEKCPAAVLTAAAKPQVG